MLDVLPGRQERRGVVERGVAERGGGVAVLESLRVRRIAELQIQDVAERFGAGGERNGVAPREPDHAGAADGVEALGGADRDAGDPERAAVQPERVSDVEAERVGEAAVDHRPARADPPAGGERRLVDRRRADVTPLGLGLEVDASRGQARDGDRIRAAAGGGDAASTEEA